MSRKRVFLGAIYLALLVAAGVWIIGFDQPLSAQGRGAAAAPRYAVQPLFPRPFSEDYLVIGSVSGVTVDSQNRIWVVHRGNDSLEGNEKGMAPAANAQGQPGVPSSSVCCMAAPQVIQYDAAGNVLTMWGGASQSYRWPQATGGITTDAKGNVWIAAMGYEPAPAGGRGRGGAPPAAAAPPAAGAAPPPPPPAPDAHVLKFSPNGIHQLTIGTPGKMDGADSQSTLNRPSALAYDSAANEIFVADMGNRRIVVFDADKGTYKRHWFAYGEKTAGAAPGPYKPGEPNAKSFRDITCVEIARDGMVYVCDKSSNRIQVFDKNGKFVREQLIAPNTGGGVIGPGGGTGPSFTLNMAGAVWDVAFSNDQAQQFLFVADGHNKKVRILRRETLEEVGSIGSGGRYPGQFLAVATVAVDGQGNVYTGEMHHGKRVQKFSPAK
jgi:DNA-binding beta-propeller fold protein YncE